MSEQPINQNQPEEIRAAVRERYAAAAKQAKASQKSSCCSSSCGCSAPNPVDEVSQSFYDSGQLDELPDTAALASLGCGNPVLLTDLKPGEVVLDLGSGGGIDVLLSANRVGPTGKAYGLDMTDEMLELARENARKAGAANVEFLKGQIESIPLPDNSVDVIISNCVINLSADKSAVLAEAYRVLKPGGRFGVADVVVTGGEMTHRIRQMLALWAGCIAGALNDQEYRRKLAAVGFQDIDLIELHEYTMEDVPEDLRRVAPNGIGLEPGIRIISAFVKAVKPNA